MQPRKLPLKAAVGACIAACLLAACSSPEPGTPSPEETPTEVTAPASQTATSPTSPAPTSPSPSTSSRSPEPSPTTLDPVSLVGDPRDVVTGLDIPWSVVFRDGVPLVSERDSGRILEVLAGGGTRRVGTVPGVVAIGESGLLGLAVGDGGDLYAYSTGRGGNRVQRFRVTGSPGSLSLGAPETILSGIPAAANHDGGRIAFGPDGMLYVATGDAAQRGNSQNRDSLGGKILRMTPDGDVPQDNPSRGSLVYSLGHRNVQGLAWTADGRMWATEFGQNTWDELNQIRPGRNYGWPLVEGIAGRDGYEDPVQQWHPSEASPSGLLAVGGTLFVANLRGQVLREIPVADPSRSKAHYTDRFGRIRAVALSPQGDLWFLTNNTDGRGRVRAGDDRIVRVRLER